MKVARAFLPLLVLLSAVVTIGCGDGRPTRVPVSGQVLIDGKPLPCGTVKFIPVGHRASFGEIGKDGRFTLSCYGLDDGAAVGMHHVEVDASELVQPTIMRWQAPKKYQDQATSGLTQEITEPTDSVVIRLTWDGGKPFDERFHPAGVDYKESDGEESR